MAVNVFPEVESSLLIYPCGVVADKYRYGFIELYRVGGELAADSGSRSSQEVSGRQNMRGGVRQPGV